MKIHLLLTTLALAALSVPIDGAGSNAASLIDAVRQGDAATVRALVQQNVDVNSTSVEGTTALHWAVQRGDLNIVTMLLSRGAKPDAGNRYGATPLRSACERGSLAIVEALLKAGAAADAVREESGETPLMIAARSGSVEIVRALLARGAKVDHVEPRRKQTALMWAAAEKHPEVVKVLLEAGANPRALSSTKISPLMFAIRAGDLASTRLLLDTGMDINAPAADGTHMLHFAIINARFDIAQYLVERGADLAVKDLHGTPLQLLTFMRKAENIALATVLPRQLPQSGVDAFALARTLLVKGDNVNARYAGGPPPRHVPVGSYRMQFTGATPLFIAATTADPAWMRFLSSNGADASIPTVANITPLLGASGIGFWEGETPGSNTDALECVKLAAQLGNDPKYVVQGGAKPDPSWEGATAMHGAATRGALEIINWLIDQGVPLDAKTRRGISPYHIATDNAGGMYHIAPEIAERLVAAGKQRGAPIDTVPPKIVPMRY
jgi:uncharacterized protein